MLLVASMPDIGRSEEINTNTVRSIHGVLPANWSLEITNNIIYVERQKPVLTYATELRPWGTNDTPESTDYWFGDFVNAAFFEF